MKKKLEVKGRRFITSDGVPYTLFLLSSGKTTIESGHQTGKVVAVTTTKKFINVWTE
jgi:hypothetical protein